MEPNEKVEEKEPDEGTDELEEMLEQLMEDEKLVIEELKHEHPEEKEPTVDEEKLRNSRRRVKKRSNKRWKR